MLAQRGCFQAEFAIFGESHGETRHIEFAKKTIADCSNGSPLPQMRMIYRLFHGQSRGVGYAMGFEGAFNLFVVVRIDPVLYDANYLR